LEKERRMNNITVTGPVDAEAELARLARIYAGAGGVGIQALNLIGGRAESLLDRLPKEVRGNLGQATERALHTAMRVADGSRGRVPDQPEWVNTAVTTAMGAVGGFGGLPSALMELPLTTTVLLRAIQGVAAEHGFDPAAENVKFDCVRVFAAAGPLAHDDGADTGFLSVRIALTGGTMQRMIGMVAPRLGAVLGQKLAAQTVPVVGALAGAATNYAYSSYYQKMAHVHFGLRRLAVDADMSHEEVLAAFRRALRPIGRG
jgi:hypothetical protein